jgi:CRP-like cAMP-binding protein
LSVAPQFYHLDNRLLAALPPDIFAALERDLADVTLEQGTVLFEPGDPIERVYFPQTGVVSLLIVTVGHMLEISTIGREGAVGFQRGLGERLAFARTTVQNTGRFSVISAARFEQIAGQNAATRDLIAQYSEVLCAEAQQTAACNALHDASSRLCRWLLQTADRLDSDVVPLTQEFMSHMLGVRRTTLTLLARTLQNKKAIRYSRGRIRIIDRALLEASACECYRVIRHDALPRRIGLKL